MNPRPNEASASPAVHSENIRQQLTELIDHLEADVGRVDDPRFRGLLEKSGDILKGLRTLFERFQPTGKGTERQGKQPSELRAKQSNEAQAKQSNARQGKQPAPPPNKVKEGHDRAPAKKGGSVDAVGTRSNAGKAPPTKDDGPASTDRAKTPRAAVSPPKGKRAARPEATGSTPDKSREASVPSQSAAANGGAAQDPGEMKAKLADQRKRARAPMMPPKSAPKPMPPQSGKPIWAKPHSS